MFYGVLALIHRMREGYIPQNTDFLHLIEDYVEEVLQEEAPLPPEKMEKELRIYLGDPDWKDDMDLTWDLDCVGIHEGELRYRPGEDKISIPRSQAGAI